MPTFVSIDSLDDPRVGDYRHLTDPSHLTDRGVFVAEGRLVLRRLLESTRFATRSILLTQAAVDNLGPALEGAAAPIYLVPQALMNDIAGFNIHRGCLAMAARPAPGVLDAGTLDRASRLVVLEGVNNPDNVGGIFRSAAAFGIDLIVLGPGCGDPLYRKAVRTSMAATLAVPFVGSGDWPGALAQLKAAGLAVVALTPGPTAVSLEDVHPSSPKIALLLGAEGDGLSPEALRLADARARIPMRGAIDSLNVTTAASIAMYHFFGRG